MPPPPRSPARSRSRASSRSSPTGSGRWWAPATRRWASCGADRRIARFITSGLDDATRAGDRRRRRRATASWACSSREQRSLRIDDVMSDPRRSRLPARPPADALLPGRARGARRTARGQPVPDRQDRRAALLARRPAAGGDVRAPGGDGHPHRATPRRPGPAGAAPGTRAHRAGPARRHHPGAVRAWACPSRTCPS